MKKFNTKSYREKIFFVKIKFENSLRKKKDFKIEYNHHVHCLD